MQIDHLVYDLDIDIVKINYDQIIQDCEKNLNIRRETAVKKYFNDNYYFFLLGKYDFSTFIRLSFSDFSLTGESIEILLESYRNAIDIDIKRIDTIEKEFARSNIVSRFMGSFDMESANIIRSKVNHAKSHFIFSSDIDVQIAKPDFKFFMDIKRKFECDPVKTLVVDDNIDSLINAKQSGYITYFYEGKIDLYKEILSKIIN